MDKNRDNKNNALLFRDLQQQISELKAMVKKTKHVPASSDKILRVDADSVEYKKGDVVKVLGGLVAEKFDGSELATDTFVPGIVKIGNGGEDSLDVFVLIDGIDYLTISATSDNVSVGDNLKPQDDYVTVAKAESPELSYWTALEDGVPGDRIRVKFLSGSSGGGGGGTSIYWAKISSGSGLEYTADIYAGFASDMTFSGIETIEESTTVMVPSGALKSSFNLSANRVYPVVQILVADEYVWVITQHVGLS